jgi:hypothetical protein
MDYFSDSEEAKLERMRIREEKKARNRENWQKRNEIAEKARKEGKITNKGRMAIFTPKTPAEARKERQEAFAKKVLAEDFTHLVFTEFKDALTDRTNPAYSACLKLALERIIPVSMFEERTEVVDNVNAVAPLLLTQAMTLLRETAERKETVIIEHEGNK